MNREIAQNDGNPLLWMLRVEDKICPFFFKRRSNVSSMTNREGTLAKNWSPVPTIPQRPQTPPHPTWSSHHHHAQLRISITQPPSTLSITLFSSPPMPQLAFLSPRDICADTTVNPKHRLCPIRGCGQCPPIDNRSSNIALEGHAAKLVQAFFQIAANARAAS